jgi:prephenate dehydrogenase
VRRAAILGTGLIGASIGLALRAQGWSTAGWDVEPSALTAAKEREAVDLAAGDVEEAVDGADLVFLAGPLQANLDMLSALTTTALITDVTSVKRPIIEGVPPGTRFVGGHPMAGREHAGPGAASPALFRGAAWIICEDGADPRDVHFIDETVQSIGANPVVMSAALHDEVVAEISHLPHLLAVALTNLVAESPGTATLVSGSFRDLTRVASADSGWWPEVLAANTDEVSNALERMIEALRGLERSIGAGDLEAVRATLDTARERRTGMAPPLAWVRVVLQDKPGEIAAVGHALAASHVDVRDLQLRHALHGGGGVLTITVRPGEAETLRTALVAEGFETE